MKSHPAEFGLVRAENIMQVLDLIANNVRPQLLAGGTDLMVLYESGHLAAGDYLSIGHLPELKQIEVTDSYVELGAAVTYSRILEHPLLQKEFPSLCQAAKETGGIAIQNRGTVGGNIMNASPAADSPPALLSYGAEICLASKVEDIWIPYHGFHTGYKQMRCEPHQILKKVRMPRRQLLVDYYHKVGTRKAQAISKVVAAGTFQDTDSGPVVRFALGSVGPVTLRCIKTEKRLSHFDGNPDETYLELIDAAIEADISPLDDIRSTKDYRLQVSKNLVREFIDLMAGAKR